MASSVKDGHSGTGRGSGAAWGHRMGLSTLDPAPATVEVSLAFLDELREKAKVVAWLEREAATAKACGDGQVSWALLHGRDAISRNEHRAEAGEKP